MYSKALIWIGVFLGSTIGGSIPTLFGADMFSFWPLLGSALGALFGIWAVVKLSPYIGY